MRLFDVEGRLVAVEGDTAWVLRSGAWFMVPGSALARKAVFEGYTLSEAEARAEFRGFRSKPTVAGTD